MKNVDVSVQIPVEHVAAMNSCLPIPWRVMRTIRLWIGTFNVKLSSEAKTRDLCKEWVGGGIRYEHAPIFVEKGQIKPRAWCYIFNLVGHILKTLDDLSRVNMIANHSFIPDNEVFVKIGGDHGGKSFKMMYQIANVEHPNRELNTIPFSVFNAKDTMPNLRICLDRYKAHIDKLLKIKWNEKNFRVFMFGDYAFLCAMY